MCLFDFVQVRNHLWFNARWSNLSTSHLALLRFHFNFRDNCSPYHFMFDHFFMSFKVVEMEGEEPLTNIRFNDHFFKLNVCLFGMFKRNRKHYFLFLLFESGFSVFRTLLSWWISISFYFCILSMILFTLAIWHQFIFPSQIVSTKKKH